MISPAIIRYHYFTQGRSLSHDHDMVYDERKEQEEEEVGEEERYKNFTIL
jgi:hypothetical protein